MLPFHVVLRDKAVHLCHEKILLGDKRLRFDSGADGKVRLIQGGKRRHDSFAGRAGSLTA